MKPPDFDLASAHRYFSAYCFNAAWELMEKRERSSEENQLMFVLNQTSLYHWLHREDLTAAALSVGFWQASRIQILLGNAPEALRFAEVCLFKSEPLSAFHQGDAHEALCRACWIAERRERAAEHLKQALEPAE